MAGKVWGPEILRMVSGENIVSFLARHVHCAIPKQVEAVKYLLPLLDSIELGVYFEYGSFYASRYSRRPRKAF